MAARQIEEFFQESGQREALAMYAKQMAPAWSLDEKLELYEAARCAYQPDPAHAETCNAAFQRIYDALSSRGWGAFRPQGPAKCWPAHRIYETIQTAMVTFAPSTGANLMNFKHSRRQAIVSAMLQLRHMKPNKDYPTMAASKFLHFFNPGLFPIWDNEFIDQKVFVRFDSDYRNFCSREGLDYDDTGAEFLGNYLCWANALLEAASPAFMPVFVEWLRDEIAPRRFRSLDVNNLLKLYATAFEFTLIGAALT